MKNYFIISASSDIGFLTAKNLLAQGKKIFITAQDSSKLAEIKSNLNCDGAVLDAADFNATENVFKLAVENLGNVDGAVNFAGSVILKPAHLTSFDEYQKTIAANLTTSFSMVRAAAKNMKNGGSVVLISSAAAMQGISNHEAIAAAKGGIISLAKSAAATYAAQNLRFNVVAPGLTATKMTKKITESESALKFSTAMHALNRIGKAEDVAAIVEFLLSENASFITGQVIGVDGGLSNLQPKIKI
ncbi:MAG: SDR family oxidoreductase [Rickettsiales bacterium]|nr:SDR family oxidoreductase [Rickettsiales bacterium]